MKPDAQRFSRYFGKSKPVGPVGHLFRKVKSFLRRHFPGEK